MEVMNSTEFEQKDVLVGGSGKTGKFTVNDDPHLMSMLSTSLYANPLRTMIQEICFNAWDAHRMGNCQDKPIDVYINATTGLIVRDYGPGIDPAMIDKIYCTYGASTKRDDPNQTGGFGLGSKSPYAYNESFMVTNHFAGSKDMYIMRRVHDDNDGGPGYDHIISGVPTEETGLMVTVSLKGERDRLKVYEYLKEILFLSGIKINIHYEDKSSDPELIEAESLAPGEFITSDMQPNGIYAVYGGVKYEIPEHDEYMEDYRLLKNLSEKLGALYIGFKPNSLTPLPNREGLNMRECSIESIREAMETIQEHFMTHLIPATKAAMIEAFVSAKSSELQAQFLVYKWQRVGDLLNIENITFVQDEVYSKILNRCPSGMDHSIWTSISKLAFTNTYFISAMIGWEKFQTMKSMVWVKMMPEYRHWRAAIQDCSKIQKTPNMDDRPKYMRWLIDTQKKIEAITGGENKPRVKVNDNHNWHILTNIRRAGKTDHLTGRVKDIVNTMARINKLKLPQKEYPDQLWFQSNGDPFNHTMKYGTVVLAKTASALADTNVQFQRIMVPRHPQTYSYDRWHWGQWTHNTAVHPVAAFIVHKKKGEYDLVKQMLEAEGYEIYEADEPETKVKQRVKIDTGITYVEAPKGPPPMYVVDYRRTDWEGTEEVKNPSTYLYCTKGDLHGYDRPYNEGLVSHVLQYAPKMVMIHNKNKAEKLSKQGVLSFEERIEEIVKKLLSDKERIRVMRVHHLMHEKSNLPEEILRIPEIQKIFGVPYLRTRQVEMFERDRKFLAVFLDDSRRRYGYSELRGITKQLKQMVKDAFTVVDDDPSVVLARKMAKASQLYDAQALRYKVAGMKPGEQKMFSQKISRFLRIV